MIESPGFFWTILWFLAAIGPLIFLHEMGHYLVARWCGVKSDTFSIGFGREIAGWTDSRGTRWKIGWIPVGGYVKFAGDMNAASQADGDWLNLPPEERAQTFHAKPVWQRALIVLAGPLANFLAAILIFVVLFATYGKDVTRPVIAEVQAGSAAEVAGLRKDDRIVELDGRTITDFWEIAPYIALHAGTPVSILIERDGKQMSVDATPTSVEFVSRFGTKSEVGRLGIASYPSEIVSVPIHRMPIDAVYAVKSTVRSIVDGLSRIIMGYIPVKELGGPVMIAKVSAEMATFGFAAFLAFMATLSINLGFINLLPVPMLDGGHLLFYALEAIRRKPVSARAQELAFTSGFMFVIGFMLMVTFNDFERFGWLKGIGDLIG